MGRFPTHSGGTWDETRKAKRRGNYGNRDERHRAPLWFRAREMDPTPQTGRAGGKSYTRTEALRRGCSWALNVSPTRQQAPEEAAPPPQETEQQGRRRRGPAGGEKGNQATSRGLSSALGTHVHKDQVSGRTRPARTTPNVGRGQPEDGETHAWTLSSSRIGLTSSSCVLAEGRSREGARRGRSISCLMTTEPGTHPIPSPSPPCRFVSRQQE